MTDITINVENYGAQNWLITPAAYAVNDVPPADIIDQRWLLMLSGVGEAQMEGTSTADWQYANVNILAPGDSSLQAALNYAIIGSRIPQPPGTYPYFKVQDEDGYSVFAGLNSIYDAGESINAGFAVDSWMPQFTFGTSSLGLQVDNLFSGITVTAGVRDNDAWLYRVGYNITLQGNIVFIV
jgi:hypothetical protein